MKLKKNPVLILMVVLFTLTALVPLVAQTATDDKGDKVPNYSSTPRKDIPVECTWNVADIYKSMDEWKNEKALLLKQLDQLLALAPSWTADAQKMLQFLDLQGDIYKKVMNLSVFGNLQYDTELSNQAYQNMKGEMKGILVRLGSEFSFMPTDILKLGKEKFDQYVKAEPRLKPYVFSIEKVLRTASHVLPSDQEKIASLAGLITDVPELASGILNNMEIPCPEITLSDGSKVMLNYANLARIRVSKNRADRDLANKMYWENFSKFQNTFATLLDGAMKSHLFFAQTHKYKDCLEARLFDDNLDPTVYHTLIESVRKNIDPFHRYLKLKKELLGLDVLRYPDIYASSAPGVNKVFTYDEAQNIILRMTSILGPEYTAGVKQAFDKRWIDRYTNLNKQKGAYSSDAYGVHPFILLNFDGQYETVSTLAHEMGHAMHSYLAYKNQHFVNANYSTFLAEIASMFNEHLLVDYMLKHETDDLFKLFILDSYMQRVKGSIYRQSQFSEYELAMHRQVEAGKSLTAEWLNQTYLDLARFYYGQDKGITDVNDYIKYEWGSIPHFFMNYYVYTYSTGMIISAALADSVITGGPAEREKYLNILRSGGSRYTADTLALAGVDIMTEKPYVTAFKRFGEYVTEMEKIVQRLKAKGVLK
ncbi:MAG: oligoendopeptidase F [Candidatus Omnitrophota bacterium]